MTDWSGIRCFYAHHDMAIHQAGPSQFGIDPYAWEHDGGITLTPIERALWSDIRASGAVLYPQYPVGRRFVDFGNPCAKVAIECDGAQWHTDAEADARRQREIEANGWTVYRFTGRECMDDEGDVTDDAGRTRLIVSETYRRICEIATRHGIRLWTPKRVRTSSIEPYRMEDN